MNLIKKLYSGSLRHLLLWASILLLTNMATAQTIEIRGTVAQKSSQESLVGVAVVEEGTTNATYSNAEGVFTLNVRPGAKLKFSYLGYIPQVIPAAQGMKVLMSEDAVLIDEVVVTGYATERKIDITGAVSVVNMKDIKGIPNTNVLAALQGRVPGMDISIDGTPGDIYTGALIRGITTMNNSSPLYVIDGVQTRQNISTLLNANDVESIQVLKDASSASIYGTQAANGVIIITTKKGRGEDKLSVTFDSKLSYQTFYTTTKMLNAQQWGEVYWEAYKNVGLTPSHDLYGNGAVPLIPEFINDARTIPAGDTDWADEVYTNALRQDYNLSVARGSKNGSSLFSFNYINHDGIIKNSNFTRYNVRINSDYSFVNNRLRVGENLNFSKYDETHKPGGIEELTIAQHPLVPVYDINGGYAGPTQGIGAQENPIRKLDESKGNRLSRWRLFGNMFIEAEPISGLVINSNFGLNFFTPLDYIFSPKWKEGDKVSDKNSLQVTMGHNTDWVWSNTINYNKTLGIHTFGALVGMEAKDSSEEALWGKKENFFLEVPEYRYLDAGEGAQYTGNGASSYRMVSYFGRANYSLMNRYLASATVRRDASSRFGQNNNAAVFPAFSVGWRLSEEAFMKELSSIDDLKIRTSWGKTGNDLIDNEATYTKYGISPADSYDIGGINKGVIPYGIVKLRTGNPDIRWETTTQTNVGIDLAMLRNRLSLSFDCFYKETTDMLMDRGYIATIGEGGTMASNVASLENKGAEIIINWRDNYSGFHYDVALTASGFKNKITKMPEDDSGMVGLSIGTWVGYKTNGVYRTQEDLNDGIYKAGKGLGRIRYVDTNGDDVINDADRVVLGNNQIKFSGGLNVSMAYKGFGLSFFLRGVVRDAYNSAKFYTDFFQGMTANHGTRLLEAWNPNENFNSTIPALTPLNTNDELQTSDYFIEDGSFLRLKEFQFGYAIPEKLLSKISMNNARIYFQAQNLFTLTNFLGADPEAPGYPYPLPRTYTFGVTFGF